MNAEIKRKARANAWNLVLIEQSRRRAIISERVYQEKKKLKPRTIADYYPAGFHTP